MKRDEFKSTFLQLTGNPPFPWQEALWEEFCSDQLPRRCDIPTGLGKTSVIACWLLARQVNQALPRRLVYVVNRRTVVDQTTAEVEKYIKRFPDLAISTLRGQFADNRKWSADPSREAVICGTVDMIGSRLLFSGYGIGRGSRPLHAGFLGQDSLIVHDEAHLEPAFQELLVGIEREQTRSRFKDFRPMRVMELSATSRVKESQLNRVIGLTDADREDNTVKERINATKRLHLQELSDSKPGAQLAALAIDKFKGTGKAVLVFVRRIEDVETIRKAMEKANQPFAELIGPMRGLERNHLTNPRSPDGSPVFARFLPMPKPDAPESEQWNVTPAKGTVFLICTSAGEVGVNISADHLLCDLSTFESMAQRFGRVNRFGKNSDTEIHVLYPSESDFEDKTPDPQRKLTLDLIKNLNGDASPNALAKLSEDDRLAAFAPTPTILPVNDILFDAWSMTSIKGKMPGRPPVEPYLHGVSDWEPPQTQVAWRSEVRLITSDFLADNPAEDLLEAYPLKPHELLSDSSKRVIIALKKLAERHPEAPIWIVDSFGNVEVTTLATIRNAKDEMLIKHRTVLLPDHIGGLTTTGLLDGNEKPRNDGVDVADAIADDSGRALRVRVISKQREHPDDYGNYRRVLRIAMTAPEVDGDDDAPREYWHWLELPQPTENSRNSIKPLLLAVHTIDVEKRAREIATGVGLDANLQTVVALAARFHDLGKRRNLWQRMIGRPEAHADKWYAKSGATWKGFDRGIDYRHEFGSVLDVHTDSDFQRLDLESQDLVLHLIAAHHGMARPHFELEQTRDPHEEDTEEAATAAAIEVPRRFARLQRKYGRWGLAYLESLLRAADWAASAEPSSTCPEDPT